MQRRLHDYSAGYVPPDDAIFEVPYLPDSAHGSLVCHNDLGISNVVFSDDAAPLPIGFIDFDYAAPVDPLFDMAVAMRHWVPLWNPADLAAVYAEVDQRARFELWADVFELDGAERRRLHQITLAYIEVARAVVLARAGAGEMGFRALVDDGYEAASLRTSELLPTLRG
jgi:aminoglycoside phosphotransferase (APT) family kinase protein